MDHSVSADVGPESVARTMSSMHPPANHGGITDPVASWRARTKCRLTSHDSWHSLSDLSEISTESSPVGSPYAFVSLTVPRLCRISRPKCVVYAGFPRAICQPFLAWPACEIHNFESICRACRESSASGASCQAIRPTLGTFTGVTVWRQRKQSNPGIAR
jgi:hypothetical protein